MKAPTVLSGPVEKRKKSPKRRAIFSGNALLLTLLVHIGFGVIAAYLIVEHFQKKHTNFTAQPPPAENTDIEHKIEVAKRNSEQSAPEDLKRIVTTAVSDVVLNPPPGVPPPEDATPTMMSGVEGEGMGAGNGSGNGPGNGGGSAPLYGVPGGVGLIGTLYDLKQTPNGTPTAAGETEAEKKDGGLSVKDWEKEDATKEGLHILHDFVSSWNTSILDGYYKSPNRLVAAQLFIPEHPSIDATKAYNVEKKVHPRRWIAIYRGTIIPPQTGDFRFIGKGDDFLMVRIGEENVLDGSWTGEILDADANGREEVGMANMGNQKLACGKWISMKEGQPLDMQVLIGEGPGGQSGFFLLVQKKGTPNNDIPVFQVQDSRLPDWKPSQVPPCFTGKRMVFGIEDTPDLAQ